MENNFAAGRTQFELNEISFTNGQFLTLPKPEAELLLRIGLAINELMLFRRFLTSILSSEPRGEAAKDIWVSQTFTAMVCLAGKTFEALVVFQKHFLQSPLGREYLPMLSEEGAAAVKKLRTMGGRDSVLADIRNLHSFHFHNGADLVPFLESLDPQIRLSLYYGLCDANVVHHFAVEPFVQSLMKTTGAESGVAALNLVGDEITATSEAFHVFARAFEDKVFQKIGPLFRATHPLHETDVCHIDAQRFPTVLIPHDSHSGDRGAAVVSQV